MKRLTKRSLDDGQAIPDDFLDCNCEEYCQIAKGCNDCSIQDCYNKLANYEDAEENRSLIKFPVGLGQKIYFLLPTEGVVDAIVGRLEADEYGIMFMVDYLRDCDSHRYSMYFSDDDIGRDVFLTREDAEEKLKELEEN